MPKTLLLADDSVVIQKLVALSFANEDIVLVSTDNGDDALAQARAVKPDLILADVVMPGKNGYEVCEAVRQDPELSQIPVLLLTGTFEAFDAERAQAVKSDGHITKPFEAQALVDRVQELLNRAPAPASAPAAATIEPEPEYDFFEESAQPLSAEAATTPASAGSQPENFAFPETAPPPAIPAVGETVAIPAIPQRQGAAAPPDLGGDRTIAFMPDPQDSALSLEAELANTPPELSAGASLGLDASDPLANIDLPVRAPRSELPLAEPPVEASPTAMENAPHGAQAGPAASPADTILSDDLFADPSEMSSLGHSLAAPDDSFEFGLNEGPSSDPGGLDADSLLEGEDLLSDLAPAAVADFDVSSSDLRPMAGGHGLDGEAVGADPDPLAQPLSGPGDLPDPLAMPEPYPIQDASPIQDLVTTSDALDIPASFETLETVAVQNPAEMAPPVTAPDLLSPEPVTTPATLDAPPDVLVGGPSPASEFTPEAELAMGMGDEFASPEGNDTSPTNPLAAELVDVALDTNAQPEVGQSAPSSEGAGRDEIVDSRGVELSPMMKERVHETLEKVAWEAFADLSDTIVREVLKKVESVAWEVIPQMAESLIQEEIRRLKDEQD